MTILYRTLALALASVLVLGACADDNQPAAAAKTGDHANQGADEHADDHGGGDDEHGDEHDDAPRWDTAALEAVGIRLETLQPTPLSEILRAPGEVVDNAYGTTLITPRTEALVVKRHARLGDEVKQGAALVTLSSVEVAAAQAALRLAEQEWKRVQALGKEAVSGRRYSEAQVAVEQARATAQAYGLGASAGGNARGEFTLSAPHAGRLTQDAFVIGQRIEPGDVLFRLVDESVVWVDAKLPSEQAHRVTIGSEADIALGDLRLRGRVMQRAHHTSEDTRNAKVRLEVANDGDRLHGGDFVEVYLPAGEPGPAQLSLPTAALVQLEGDSVAFRQDGEALEAVPVRTGAVIGNRTVILGGLAAGDRVVVEGAYVVKAQKLKSQLGEGHAH
jgi:cobalt-zinc-cadmium efflux system membrane fusion protein